MRQVITAIAIFFLLLPGLVCAQEIREYSVSAQVEGRALKEMITITIVNNHDTDLVELNYPFNGRLVDLITYDDRGGLESRSNYRTGKTYVTTKLRKPLKTNETAVVNYEFTTQDIISEFNNTHILSTTYSLLANVKRFSLEVTLPEGMLLTEGVSTVPKPAGVDSDGRHVILRWEETNPTEFRVYVNYEPFIKETVIREDRRTEYTIYLLTLLTFGAIALHLRGERASRLIFRILRRGVSEKIDILREDEQVILKLVMDEDGIDQRKIQEITDFSKAKVSKIVSELENRGAVRKEQRGRRNKIYLAEKLRE